ncbi:MAG: cell division protein FtsZ, partial [Mesonia sp.]
EIEISGNTSGNGEKRYSLEDYMELENTINEAKPKAPKATPAPKKPEARREAEPMKKTTQPVEEKPTPEAADEDPLNNPISEDLIARAEERRARMKSFNYKFRNNQSSIDEIEKQPAYKRAGLDLDNSSPSQDKLSRTSISKDSNDEVSLRSNNSFLHDNVD